MFGPKPSGTWSNLTGKNCGRQYQFLKFGIRYRVIKEFYDFDHHLHPIDEVWTFWGIHFYPMMMDYPGLFLWMEFRSGISG
jgi:hypothetical protein